jgi:Ca2+-binding RTX toxin-like protein
MPSLPGSTTRGRAIGGERVVVDRAEGAETVMADIVGNETDQDLVGTDADGRSCGGGKNGLHAKGGNDELYDEAGNDLVAVAAGADSMFGGSGDDTYRVDDIGDVVSGETVAGVDDSRIGAVQGPSTCTLDRFFEGLALTGTAAIGSTGNELANKIAGNEAAYPLSGGRGNELARVFAIPRSGATRTVPNARPFPNGRNGLNAGR